MDLGNRLKCLLFLSGVLLLCGCSTIPITGRSQFVMVSASELNSQAELSYRKLLDGSVLSKDLKQTARLKRVGEDVARAAESFLTESGQAGKIKNYDWEFNLIDDPETVNAFCLPGGKVAVYTGILKLAADDDSLAVVVAHEVAHAIANHSAERMTQMMLARFGEQTLSAAMKDSSQTTKEFFDLAYGLGANLGVILPYSRLHENEADHIGLILMAKAGYDPRAALGFWQKMQSDGSAKIPELLSTHPVAQTRIDNIRALLPEALEFYKK